MGRRMKTRFLTTLLGLAIVAAPAIAPASQPAVRLADLELHGQQTMSALDLAMLLADPREAVDLSVVLPSGFTMLDIDRDPFDEPQMNRI